MCGPIGCLCRIRGSAHMANASSLGARGVGGEVLTQSLQPQSWESQDLSSNSVSSCRHSSVPSHHLILAVCCAHSGPIIGTWMTDCQVSALPPANLESSQGGFSNPAFWVPAACSSPQTYSLPPSLSPPCEAGHSNEAVHGNDVRETRNEHQTSRTNSPFLGDI